MALFTDHPLRSVIGVVAALFAAHVLSMFISFFEVFHLSQASLAVLAVSGLMYLIAFHHRRDGQLLTHTQEEALLIACFGVFWMSVLVGWRALKDSRSIVEPRVEEIRESGRARDIQPVAPYPCQDWQNCIVEEYYW